MALLSKIKYPVLKEAIDNIVIIDDHAHLGLVDYYADFPEKNRIPFVVDLFKTPAETSYGWDYLKELHYEAYEKFYGFSRADLEDPSKRDTLALAYQERRKDLGSFLQEIMAEAKIEKVLTNMRKPQSLADNSQIPLVPWLDCLILPFDNTYLKKRLLGSWYISCNEYELKLLKEKYSFTEGDFSDYLQFIDQVVADFIATGSPALKFLLATQRHTHFEKVPEEKGPDLYEKAKQGDLAAYNNLQDLLVWHIMRLAIKYDVPVQVHCAVLDNSIDYYDALNWHNFIGDPEMSNLKLVILHASYPSFDHAQNLASAGLTPNQVYIDISGRIMFGNHPQVIAKMLRKWLDVPMLWNKIIYGSDTLFGERFLYTCARTGRDGVYLALADMIEDEMISEETAVMIARKILRENALNLYKLS